MFDIGWQELFIVAILALIVVGPKDLPRAIRNIMGLVRKARIMARDFQVGIDEVVREADLDDMKNDIEKLSNGEIDKQIKSAFDPRGDLTSNIDFTEIEEELNDTLNENLSVGDAISQGPLSSDVIEEAKASKVKSDKEH
jgi:sec-independent protein translocase protein TatB